MCSVIPARRPSFRIQFAIRRLGPPDGPVWNIPPLQRSGVARYKFRGFTPIRASDEIASHAAIPNKPTCARRERRRLKSRTSDPDLTPGVSPFHRGPKCTCSPSDRCSPAAQIFSAPPCEVAGESTIRLPAMGISRPNTVLRGGPLGCANREGRTN